jgi:lipoprotein-anchoring transpeptidase ErfK/SrfK
VISGTLAPNVSLALANEATTTIESPPPVTDEPTTTIEAPTTTTLPANLIVVGAFPNPVPVVGNADGANTAIVQLRLRQLGFWNAGTDGKFGVTTKQAVMAFQKYMGIEATGLVDENTATQMTTLDIKAHGQTDEGTLIEVDKAKQLLFVVVDGITQWVFNASTGNGLPFNEPDKNTPGAPNITGVALTPDGMWKVNRERPKGWWEGDLGQIYRPKYFNKGIAVHGSNSVPNFPASHGCVRISVPAMDFIWDNNIMPMKSIVWVHS